MTLLEKFAAESGVTGPFNIMTCGIGAVKIFQAREKAIHDFSFAIITEKVIQEIKKYGPILEVGAGTGYWAYEFKKAGVDYIATDVCPCNSEYFSKKEPWTKVEKMDAIQAVAAYPDRTLLICWPDYGKSWATEVLNNYSGEIVIYVGEYEGCTADESFSELLYKNYDLLETIIIPQWWGIHDEIFVYRKRNPL